MQKRTFYLFLFFNLFFTFINLTAQKSFNTTYQIKYLDEFIIYNTDTFQGSKIGGLSSIEYYNNEYYLVCDNTGYPRFYKASITINNDKIDTISIDKLIQLKDTKNQFLANTQPDLEALRVVSNSKILISSEGSIRFNKNPSIFEVDHNGNYIKSYAVPNHFLIGGNNTARNNGIFEGLCIDYQKQGFWVATEVPLKNDGEEPTIKSEGAPVRITHYNPTTNKADYQFLYPLDKLSKDPKGKFGVNGITGLIQIAPKKFIIIERGYSSGYGNQGNTVRIYEANINDVTNSLNIDSIKEKKVQLASKKLLFDFESVRDLLTNNSIDNIEGITLGPKLKNGNQSLILVSDNNFSPPTKQLNQFILLELKTTIN